VESQWQLELPANPMAGDPAQFDYATISDVVLHMRYTARPGGNALRNGALTDLRRTISDAQGAGSVRLLSARHDFPDAWARFTGSTPPDTDRFRLSLPLSPQLYPFWATGTVGAVKALDVLAQRSPGSAGGGRVKVFRNPRRTEAGPEDHLAELTEAPVLGNLLRGGVASDRLPASPTSGSIDLFFDGRDFDDVWVAVTWGT
jgi:hypothetical protein